MRIPTIIIIFANVNNKAASIMATSNFDVRNASKVYVVSFEGLEFDEVISKIDFLRERALNEFNGLTEGSKSLVHRNETLDIPIHDDYLSIDTSIFLREGYYEDANLDFEITFNTMHAECSLTNNSLESVAMYLTQEMTKGLPKNMDSKTMKKLKDNYLSFCKDKIKKAYDYAEKVCDFLAENKLKKVAVFSNGETLYEKVS